MQAQSYQDRKTLDIKIEKFLKMATKLYIGHSDTHLSYENRLARLELLSLEQRRIIAGVSLILKIINKSIYSNLHQSICQHIFVNNRNHRSPHIFNIDNNLPYKSPLGIIMNNCNKYKNYISLSTSIQENTKNLTIYFMGQNQRT